MRYHNYKFQFNLRGDDGAHTGGLAVDTNLGWKGAEKYIATVPQVFDLWADPQERYDMFMNNFTERTWMGPVMGQELKGIKASYVQYPPRKLQSLRLHGADHHLELSEISAAARSACQGRIPAFAADCD